MDMLYAILQGLPYNYLEHLDPPWPLIAKRIYYYLKAEYDAVTAVKYSFLDMTETERAVIKETLIQVMPVMQIPGLSYRQREALIALRSAKTASLAQLCRVLMQDRGNTHRRMSALVKKGLAVRFFQPGGVFYFAVQAPLEKSVKSAVNTVVNDLILAASAVAAAPYVSGETYQAESLVRFSDVAKQRTTLTTPTTST